MSAKNSVTVVIAGKVTRLSGYESEEYLQRVASYLNHKISELSEIKGYNRLSSGTKENLLTLNIRDVYFNATRTTEIYNEDLENKDREIYDLKQKIVELQMDLEELTAPSQERPAGRGKK